MGTGTGFLERHGNIAVYVPNLIGYVRIICAVLAFALALQSPVQTLILYLFSFVCDELDGRAARSFNQTSTLGAVLDMLTDRLATTGLLTLCCMRFPACYMLFLGLIFLDVFSHWLQMYSSLAAGDLSHKQTFNQSWLVSVYYRQRIFMGFCCVCCEVLYLAVYLLSWPQFQESPAVPVRLPRQIEQNLPGVDGARRLSLVSLVAILAVPGFLVKQIVNVAQIHAAANALILLDQKRDQEKSAKSR